MTIFGSLYEGFYPDTMNFFHSQESLGYPIAPFSVVIAMLPIIVATFILGIILAIKAWRVHYPKEKGIFSMLLVGVTIFIWCENFIASWWIVF